MFNEKTILQLGDSNELVTQLQQMLKIINIYNASISKVYDQYTKSAVINFQKQNNLEQTGVVNYDTFKLLIDITQPTTFTNLNKEILKIGSSGEDVIELQEKLKTLLYYNDTIDGIFDETLEKSVKSFQYNTNILADGIVDNSTWTILNELYKPLAICDNTEDNSTYTVKQGDTLYSIARNFNITVDKLKELNNLTSDILSIGQVLKIEQSFPQENIYTVVKGDTLYSIANKFNTTVDEIKRLNNLTSNVLSVGQILKIEEETQSNVYIVKLGDTLYSISKQFGISVDEIKKLNNLATNDIYVNQQLILSGNIPEENTYQVVKGDTLYSIAKRFNTTVSIIREKNNLTSDSLSIGQILKI